MKNIFLLTLTALLESLQLIIVVGLVYSFIPFPLDNTYYSFFPFMRKGLTPNRNMLLYRIYVAAAIALQTGLLFFHKKSPHDGFLPKVRAWTAMAAIILLPQLFLIYQVWLGAHPEQSRQELCVVCALAYVVRIFWPEAYRWIKGIMGAKNITWHLPKGKDFEIFWQSHRDLIVLFSLSCAFSIQACLYASAIYGWAHHLAVWPPDDPWHYAGLAVLCLAVSSAAILAYARRGILTGFCRRHAARAIIEGLLAFFLLNALLKMHFYYYQPLLAQKAYQIILAVSLLVKIFWPFLERFFRAIGGLVMDENNQPALRIMGTGAFVVFIFLFLYVPDMETAIARVFMGEQFHAIDACLMNTGWAFHAGCKLNVDVNNRYGLGMAVMVSQLSNLFGGFTYVNVYTIVMLACIVYFIAAFGLLRWWLNSVPMAMAGTLILLKMQPFHDETASFYLTNPSTTVCRYFFDLPFLFMVFLFLRTSKRYFLLGAASISAIALFYSLDTGVYLSVAFYASLVLVYSFKDTRAKVYRGAKDNGFAALLCLIPPLGAVALLRLTQGPEVFSSQFWQNMTAYVRQLLWQGPIPFWGNLSAQQYWIFSLGVGAVLLYVFTMIFIGSLVYLRRSAAENFFVVIVCVYGLALSNYYINRAEQGSLYSCIVPYVFILCFWVQFLARRLSVSGVKKFYMIFLGLCLYGLWTTHLTLAYPNVFNFSHNPAVDPMVAPKLSQGRLGYFNQLFIQYPDAFKLQANNLGETFEDWRTEDDFSSDDQLKQYFQREFNFSEDAALIDGLTKPGQPVALISSFEIQMLIQADRKPFFYIFPLVNSRPMRMRLFEVTHMWTTTQLNDTIQQLEDKKPDFVFMERVYMAREIPASFLYDMPAVCALDNYVRQNYEPYAIGKYLVAMKLRKPL